MYSLKQACEIIDKAYKRGGFPGIGEVADVGAEWVFVPKIDEGVLIMGEDPLCFNKETGTIRRMQFFSKDDDNLLKNGRLLQLPSQFIV